MIKTEQLRAFLPFSPDLATLFGRATPLLYANSSFKAGCEKPDYN